MFSLTRDAATQGRNVPNNFFLSAGFRPVYVSTSILKIDAQRTAVIYLISKKVLHPRVSLEFSVRTVSKKYNLMRSWENKAHTLNTKILSPYQCRMIMKI